MRKEQIITKITDCGVVAVVRAQDGESARRIAEACLEGGIPAIEITFTVPGAHRVIEALSAVFSDGSMLVGAGTVLDPETARIAMLSGAQYIVSPSFNPETVRLCNRYRVPCMPGVGSMAEVVTALESGVDIIKVFPGELFGPKIIKAIKGPLPQAQLMPTGGVDLDNVAQWIAAGAVAVGVGGSLTSGANTGDYASVTAKAKAFVAQVAAARKA